MDRTAFLLQELGALDPPTVESLLALDPTVEDIVEARARLEEIDDDALTGRPARPVVDAILMIVAPLWEVDAEAEVTA